VVARGCRIRKMRHAVGPAGADGVPGSSVQDQPHRAGQARDRVPWPYLRGASPMVRDRRPGGMPGKYSRTCGNSQALHDGDARNIRAGR